ncbi:MAG TPA: hypothetical protein VMD76_07760 [Candidatus Sulfotelmatobacter sp.]|nr:hypothetical protein [Candidatus Sulfotelmatobacter sp.]
MLTIQVSLQGIVRTVRAGKVAGTPDPPDHVLYKVDGFSFLMSAEKHP